MNSVATRLGHVFARPTLLRNALTHRSFGASNNERLEFLGDGILDFVIAEALFKRFPEAAEGDLSRMRANLVRQDTLHGLAQSLSVGQHLLLGEGELKSGGAERPSILADALEALFGAVYLDAGFEASKASILRLYTPLLEQMRAGPALKDAKTRLQEWLQGRKKPLPRYQLLETLGAAHEQRFVVVCEMDSLKIRTQGEGTSRRIAEQVAAEQALKELDA